MEKLREWFGESVSQKKVGTEIVSSVLLDVSSDKGLLL